MTPRLVLRLVGRDWRGGELRLLLVALLVAVGTVTAISLFVDRLQSALIAESATFLAADRVISSSRPIPEEFASAAAALGLAHTETVSFPTMVFAAGNNRLVAVKAVGVAYPLRGVLRIADEPFGRQRVTNAVPAPGEAWLDARLFPSLGIALGDTVEVGYTTLTVTRVIASEPDRGGGLFDLGPRLMMRAEDVAATRVVQPGSRIGYRLLVAGPEPDLVRLKARLNDVLNPHYRWRGIKDSSPAIGGALERAETFLLLGGLLAVLLAGVAVALAAQRYARRHYDHVGVMKTLGATPGDVMWGYAGVLALIGAIGIASGLLTGLVVQYGIVALLSTYLPVTLPAAGVRPFLLGTVTGVVCLVAFALPPLVALRNVSPMRVIRRDLPAAGASRALTYSSAAIGTLALLIWYTGDAQLTLWVIVGIGGVSAVLALLALVLLSSGRQLGMRAGSGWRLALAALRRRSRENVAQIMIFGLGIMLLLILVLVRTSLLDDWQQQMPADTPNHFIMNVTPDEVAPVGRLLASNAQHDGRLTPMIRGRVVSVNGQSARDWQRDRDRDSDGAGVSLLSERNLTWLDELPRANRVTHGRWWDADDARSLVSLERDYAEAFGLEIGTRMTFDVGGTLVDAEVASFRQVEWDSLQPNFFVIFSPAALEGVQTTFMTSFFLAEDRKLFLNEFLGRYPTITVIEIDAIIAQVQSIIARVTQAVELVLALVLCAGALVLVASIQASRDERVKEHALLRALGGERRLIRGALIAEFAALGFFAGIVAVIGAEATVYVLQTQIFETGYEIHPWVWLLGPVLGAALIALIGILGTRRLIDTPPMMVLRDLA